MPVIQCDAAASIMCQPPNPTSAMPHNTRPAFAAPSAERRRHSWYMAPADYVYQCMKQAICQDLHPHVLRRIHVREQVVPLQDRGQQDAVEEPAQGKTQKKAGHVRGRPLDGVGSWVLPAGWGRKPRL